MKKRPSLYLFFSTLTGALLALTFPLNFAHCGIGALVFFLALVLLKNHLPRIVCLLITLTFLAALSTVHAIHSYHNLSRSLNGDEAIFEGVIKEVWHRPDGSKKVQAALKKADDEKAPALNITLSLHGAAAGLDVEASMPVRISAKLVPLEKPLSPVHFDAYRYGLAHGLHGRATITDARLIWLGKAFKQDGIEHLRQVLKERIFKTLTPHQGSLLLALIIGDTSFFAEEQKEIYQYIGAQHLLAVSGLQITLIGYLCFLIFLPFCAFLLPLRRIHYSHFLAGILTLGIIWFFVALCHWPKSAIRAAFMASAIILPSIVGRRQETLDAFFTSAWITLLIEPLSILDVGFLLSYGAVFGLIITHNQSSLLRKKVGNWSWLAATFLSSFLSSIAAFLATLPIVIGFFGTIAPMSAMANFLLVPVASVLQVPAIICGVLGALINVPILIELGAFFASVIEILAQALSEAMGHITYITTAKSLFAILIAFSLFTLMLGLLRVDRVVIALGLFILVLSLPTLLIDKDQALTVRVLAVGQGDSTLFSLPSGHHMLIDAGGQPFSSYDPGQAVVAPTLRRLGIKKLDILVITHPDPDHVLGAFFLLETLPVKEIWHSGFKPTHPLTERLLERALAKGITLKNAKELLGSHSFGSTQVEVLAPQALGTMPYHENLSANNNSLVLRIVHNDIALLWPGDIEQVGENLLLNTAKNIEATVLKAPHHGSKTSSTSSFIDAVNPRYVIYSTGINNRFHFPHKEVADRYKKHGAISFNTALDGEITMRIKGAQVSLTSYARLPASTIDYRK